MATFSLAAAMNMKILATFTMAAKDGEAPKLHPENGYRNFWNP